MVSVNFCYFCCAVPNILRKLSLMLVFAMYCSVHISIYVIYMLAHASLAFYILSKLCWTEWSCTNPFAFVLFVLGNTMCSSNCTAFQMKCVLNQWACTLNFPQQHIYLFASLIFMAFLLPCYRMLFLLRPFQLMFVDTIVNLSGFSIVLILGTPLLLLFSATFKIFLLIILSSETNCILFSVSMILHWGKNRVALQNVPFLNKFYGISLKSK